MTFVATTQVMIEATTQPKIPTLAEQVTAVASVDPLLLGATGYLNDVFTTRLVGDSL